MANLSPRLLRRVRADFGAEAERTMVRVVTPGSDAGESLHFVVRARAALEPLG